MTITIPSREFVKTVAVLGTSYGGMRAAQVLAAGLPDTVRIVVIDRNSHANHLYVFPRYAILQGHEHKAFIPYTNVFHRPATLSRTFLHAKVLSLAYNSVILSRPFPEHDIPSSTLYFDYAIYALGSLLPRPLDLWRHDDIRTGHQERLRMGLGSKKEGIEWLKDSQERVQRASSILVVGGGALGIQFASDIAEVYPAKEVTLLHSRLRLLPKFDELMHAEVLTSLTSLGVRVMLGERLELTSASASVEGKQTMLTTSGREIAADLVLLCTGQISNTELLTSVASDAIDPITKQAHVLRTLQLAPLEKSPESLSKALDKLKLSNAEKPRVDDDEVEELAETPYPHIFVIGDSADAFGAIKAGHNAYYQGEVAARNVIRLIKRDWDSEKEHSPWIVTGEADQADKAPVCDGDSILERYTPLAPAIKVTLGLTRSVSQMNGVIEACDTGKDDLDAHLIWSMFGANTTDMTL